MASDAFNILISAAGRRVGLMQAFRETLAALGLKGALYAGEISRLSSAGQLADQLIEVPRCTSDAFIPEMLALSARHGIKLIIPTIDTELPVYAAHREAFQAIGCEVPISSPEAIRIASDKRETHAFLMAKDLPTVAQGEVEDVLADPARFAFPLLVKPTRGSSSIGISIVHHADALRLAGKDRDVVVQTLATGEEYTVSVLVDAHGRALCAVPRKRLEVRHGEVSKGLTVRAAGLEDVAKRCCEALPGAFGPMNVQIFWDQATDTYRIIEINARFGGGFPLAYKAGADYPRWIVEACLGLPSTATATGWRDGLLMLRYDDAVYLDAADAGIAS